VHAFADLRHVTDLARPQEDVRSEAELRTSRSSKKYDLDLVHEGQDRCARRDFDVHGTSSADLGVLREPPLRVRSVRPQAELRLASAVIATPEDGVSHVSLVPGGPGRLLGPDELLPARSYRARRRSGGVFPGVRPYTFGLTTAIILVHGTTPLHVLPVLPLVRPRP